MGWFKRLKEGITTKTINKKDTPEGIWYKCKKCKEASVMKEFNENYYKCPKCNYHERIGSEDYFDLIFDGKYTELFGDLVSKDFLNFTDLKPYDVRLAKAREDRSFRCYVCSYWKNRQKVFDDSCHGFFIYRWFYGICSWRENLFSNRLFDRK